MATASVFLGVCLWRYAGRIHQDQQQNEAVRQQLLKVVATEFRKEDLTFELDSIVAGAWTSVWTQASHAIATIERHSC
eukprot:112388-Pleurochrysis_carterae.AAC.1